MQKIALFLKIAKNRGHDFPEGQVHSGAYCIFRQKINQSFKTYNQAIINNTLHFSLSKLSDIPDCHYHTFAMLYLKAYLPSVCPDL